MRARALGFGCERPTNESPHCAAVAPGCTVQFRIGEHAPPKTQTASLCNLATRKKRSTRGKNNFPTSKSAVYERYCNFALALGAAAKHGFRPKRHPPRFRLASDAPLSRPFFPLTIAR